MTTVICAQCGNSFRAWPSDKRRYCSRRCFDLGHTKSYSIRCEICGRELIAAAKQAKSGERRFCSRRCAGKSSTPPGSQTGEKSSSWKGGRFQSSIGYEMVLLEGQGKYTTAQKAIMEKTLGRKLRPGEVVHHRDGDKMNNDVSNLEVMSRAAHARIHKFLKKEIGR